MGGNCSFRVRFCLFGGKFCLKGGIFGGGGLRWSTRIRETAAAHRPAPSLMSECVEPWCQGSRSELGYTGNICPYCEGTGQETVRTGHITARSTCSYCNGEKIFIKFKCLECEGIGKKTFDTPVVINIPPGKYYLASLILFFS